MQKSFTKGKLEIICNHFLRLEKNSKRKRGIDFVWPKGARKTTLSIQGRERTTWGDVLEIYHVGKKGTKLGGQKGEKGSWLRVRNGKLGTPDYTVYTSGGVGDTTGKDRGTRSEQGNGNRS